MTKFNEIEKRLMRKAIGFYKKDLGIKVSSDDKGELKDAIQYLHDKGHVNKPEHKIMYSIFKKLEDVTTIKEEADVIAKKEAEMKRIAEEEAKKAEEEAKKAAEAEAVRIAEEEAKKAAEIEAALEEESFDLDDILAEDEKLEE